MSYPKRWPVGTTLAFLGVGFVLATAALAQDWKGQGRLAGIVLDEEGKPIAGAQVKLELPGRGAPEVLTTDKKGRWAILGLAGGRWNVDIGAEGYVTKNLFANVLQGRHLPQMETTLEKAAPAGPPPEVLAAVTRGDEAYKAGRYAEARIEYEKLLELRPDLTEALLMQIAHCHKQEGNPEKEMEYLNRVLAEDPDNAAVRTLMAMEALEAGLIERGVELLAQIEDASITDPDIFYNIGVSLLNKGRTDDAIVYFSKSVTLRPDYVDGYFQRGLALFGNQKYEDCRRDFEKVLELSPDGAQAETARKVIERLPAQP